MYHWLDSNVFIQAANGPYSFTLAPTFWNWLLASTTAGKIRTPVSVHAELLQHKDQLSRWVKMHRSCGLFVNPSAEIQALVGRIGVVVQSKYESAQSKKFMSGADPWVIAHAIADRGVVVTHEVLGGDGCKEVKIPNICRDFSVKCLAPYPAFEALKLRL